MRVKFAKLPLYLGMVVLFFSVLVAVIQLNQKSPVLLTRSSANVSTAVMALSPAEGKYSKDQEVDMGVTFSADEFITGADVVISFNPENIEIDESRVAPGNLFSLAYVQADREEGKMTATLISKNKQGEKSGILLRFKFVGETGGVSRMEFDRDTKLIDTKGNELSTDFKMSQITFK